MHRLGFDFFNRHVVEVAQDLLGKRLIFSNWQGIITETEAYRGADDQASHAFAGPTLRSSIMFGEPGRSYVYFIYGMHHCLNIVTEPKGQPSAVLIRGLKLLLPATTIHLNGPGKICRHLQINLQHNGLDFTQHPDCYIENAPSPIHFQRAPRIGIRKATDKLWRFVISESGIDLRSEDYT